MKFGIAFLAAVCVASVSCGAPEPESKSGARKTEPDAAPEATTGESAQESGRIAADVVRVSESRAGRPNKDPTGYTSVSIRFESFLENADLIRLELSGAKDSLGNDLIDPEKAVVETVGKLQAGLSDQFEARVSLRLAAREAKEIAEITGRAVFHDPAAAPDPIDIDDFRKQPGEFIPNEAFGEAGLSIAYLDEATFDEKGSKLIAGKILGAAGRQNDFDETAIGAMAAPMKVLFQMKGTNLFIIDDPKSQLIKLEGLGPDNASLATGMESVKGLWIVAATKENETITKIRIHLRSNDAEVSREFAISNIQLP